MDVGWILCSCPELQELVQELTRFRLNAVLTCNEVKFVCAIGQLLLVRTVLFLCLVMTSTQASRHCWLQVWDIRTDSRILTLAYARETMIWTRKRHTAYGVIGPVAQLSSKQPMVDCTIRVYCT